MKRALISIICAVMLIGCIAALGACTCNHGRTEWRIDKAATCSEEGMRTLCCKKCGKTFDSEIIPMSSHVLADITPVPATCTEKGSRGGKYCTECNQTIVTPEEVAALSHKDVDHNCRCDVCSGIVHNYGDWGVVKETSCKEEGLRERTCAYCHKVESEAIARFAHDMEDSVAVQATCTTSGKTAGSVCRVCDYGDAPEYVEALGHDYKNGKCTRCEKENKVTEGLYLQLQQPIDKDAYYMVNGFDEDAPHTTELVIPSTYKGKLVKAIYMGAFENSDIISVEIPFSVTTIGQEAFKNCTSLERVVFEENSRLETLDAGVFAGCSSLESIELPPSVNKLLGSFVGSGLTTFDISANVTHIEDAVFSGTSITEFTVDSDNTYYQAIDGNLYTKDGKMLLAYATGKSDTSFTLPDGVEIIATDAFKGANLETIEFGVNSKLYTICDGAFAESAITEINLPSKLFEIGDGAFAECYYLETVNIGGKVAYIGKCAFKKCTALKYAHIARPSALVSIGEEAFFHCESLEYFVVPVNVDYMGADVFREASIVQIYVCRQEADVILDDYHWDTLWFGDRMVAQYGYEGELN